MISKLIPAVIASLGLGLIASVPAQAEVVVGFGLPGVIVAPPVLAAPYLSVGYGPYWYRRPYYRAYAPYGYRREYRAYGYYGYYGHGYGGHRWR